MTGGALFLIVVAAAAISAGLIAALRPLLVRNALAKPNARSSHREPTPQGGGIAATAKGLMVDNGSGTRPYLPTTEPGVFRTADRTGVISFDIENGKPVRWRTAATSGQHKRIQPGALGDAGVKDQNGLGPGRAGLFGESGDLHSIGSRGQ